MVYQSKQERINQFITQKIIPLLSNKDLDFNEVVIVVMENCLCNRELAIQELQRLISFKKIKEIHVLTIPDEQIGSWINQMVKTEKEDLQVFKEVLEQKSEDNNE